MTRAAGSLAVVGLLAAVMLAITRPVWSGRVVHDARAYWRPILLRAWRSGRPLTCPRCLDPISPYPDDGWDVGHVVDLVAGGHRGVSNQHPEHARCNRSAGATALADRRRGARTHPDRWTD